MRYRIAGHPKTSKRWIYNCVFHLYLLTAVISMAQFGIAACQDSSNGTNNTNDLIIKIEDPIRDDGKNFSHVHGSIEISGSISRELPEDKHMWLMVNPHSAINQWWPQGGGRIEPDIMNKRWYGLAIIGGGEGDNGKKFDIAVILVNNEDDQKLNDWVNITNANRNWPSILTPKSAEFKDRITVIRSQN